LLLARLLLRAAFASNLPRRFPSWLLYPGDAVLLELNALGGDYSNGVRDYVSVDRLYRT
jgi:hypothetical protein